MDIIKTATGVVALLGTLGAALYTGISEIHAVERRAEAKYVPLSDWKDFRWSQLKRDIREIEKELAGEDPGSRYAEKLEDSLEDLYAYLCREYPDDRDCQ
jgi:hypothetical protein